jgi:FixJ family two-component response regulator
MTEQKVIIIIEDEEDWLETLSSSISGLGYKIEQYSSFDVAQKRLMDNRPYHLVITDIYPNKSAEDAIGLEIAESVSFIKDIPVIVVSGVEKKFRQNVIRAFKDCKVVDFFEKSDFDRHRMKFVKSVKCALEKHFIHLSNESDDNHKVIHIEKGTVLINEYGHFEDLIQLVSEKFANLVSNYDDKIKNELNQIINHLDELVDDRQELFSQVITQLERIAETNESVNDYLIQISETEPSKNGEILKKKLELSIALIPGILKLNTDLDLESSLKKIGEKYNEITFKAYEKLTTIYYSLREKLIKPYPDQRQLKLLIDDD